MSRFVFWKKFPSNVTYHYSLPLEFGRHLNLTWYQALCADTATTWQKTTSVAGTNINNILHYTFLNYAWFYLIQPFKTWFFFFGFTLLFHPVNENPPKLLQFRPLKYKTTRQKMNSVILTRDPWVRSLTCETVPIDKYI